MITLPFYYLGSRKYVNGISIFEEMLKAFMQEPRFNSCLIKKIVLFKVNRFVRSGCQLEIFKNGGAKEKSRKAASRMDVLLDDGTVWQLLITEIPDNPVTRTSPDYDRGMYIENEYGGEGNGCATLHNITNAFDVVRGVVEANYRYCVRMAAADGVHGGVSWAYLTKFIWPVGDLSVYSEVRFRDNSKFVSNGRVFVIREMSIGVHKEYESEICFFYNVCSQGCDSGMEN